MDDSPVSNAKLVAWAVAALILAGLVFAAWLFGTQRGTAVIHAWVAARLPLALTIEGVSGTLWSGLAVDSLAWSAPGIDVRATGVVLQPAWPRSLAQDQIVLESVTVSTMEIDIHDVGKQPPARVDFAVPALPIALAVDEVRINDLRAVDLPAAQKMHITGTLVWNDSVLAISALDLVAPSYTVNGDVGVSLDGAFPIDAALRWTFEVFTGRATIAGTLAQLEIDHDLQAPFRASTQGTVSVLGQLAPTADLTMQVPEYRDGDVLVSNVMLRLRGNVDDYAVSGSASIDWLGLSGSVETRISGTRDALQVTALDVASSRGEVSVVGTLGITERSLELHVRGHKLDPSLMSADLHGRLDAEGLVRGSWSNFDVTDLVVEGELGGHPIAATGTLRWVDSRLGATVSIDSDGNRIEATGSWTSDAIELVASVDVARIDGYLPDLSGAIQARVTLQGAPDALSGHASGSMTGLSWRVVELSTGTFELSLVDGNLQRLQLDDAVLSVGEVVAHDIELRADLDDAAWVGALTWTLDEHAGRLQVRVSHPMPGAWRLHIDKDTHLALPHGVWSPDADVEVRITGSSVTTAKHCWRPELLPEAGRGEICIEDLMADADQFQTAGRIAGLELGFLGEFLPALPAIDGAVDGRWDLGYRNGNLLGDARLKASGLFMDPLGDRGEDRIALPDLSFELHGDERGVRASLAGRSESATLAGMLRLRGLSSNTPLDGRLEVSIADISNVRAFSRHIGSLAGSLKGSATIGGTLDAPIVEGNVDLAADRFEWLDPAIELTELTLTSDLSVSGIEIRGRADNAAGELALDAMLTQLFSGNPLINGRIRTDGLDVRAPDVEVIIVGDVLFESTNRGLNLAGRLELPRGEITMESPPATAVRRSPDVVVVNRSEAPTRDTQLSADLDIVLGEQVSLSAYGLQSKLGGRLRVRRSHAGVSTVVGQVQLDEGRFKAFGQELEVERGTLTFSGPPETPYVDARAVLRTDSAATSAVLAGVEVRGPIDAMQTTLFSEPAMSDAEVLSYLVLGRPLDEASSADGTKLSNAAIAMGLTTASPVFREVRDRFGLEELGTTGSGDDLSLIAGTRVNDRLFVRYTYHTLTRLSALLLRYDLSKRLSVEAIAGPAPGTDFLYRVRDR